MFYDLLDISARAAALGLTCRELVALGQGDRRILAAPSLETDGAVARLKRWLAAGSPPPDLSRLEFGGCDAVRAIVMDLLRRAPAPVAWHGVEHVTWLEVGRSAGGWQGTAPLARAPVGDQAQVIVIDGRQPDEYLVGLVAHELGHGWRAPIRSFGARIVRMPQHELAARVIAAERVVGSTITSAPLQETIEQLVRADVREEQRADELATLWGSPRAGDYARLARNFRDEYQAAAELAMQIERDIESDTQGAA